MRSIRKALVSVGVAGVLTLGLAGPAAAQPIVAGGLVNVTLVDVLDVEGNQVVAGTDGDRRERLPTVNAAVLAQELIQDGEADCDATASSAADSQAILRFLERHDIEL